MPCTVCPGCPFFGGGTSGGGSVISEVKEKLPVGVEVQMSIVGLLKEKEDEIVNYVRLNDELLKLKEENEKLLESVNAQLMEELRD
ncbi:hypothetical protein Tco_0547791 [Tanacetum coccineum]